LGPEPKYVGEVRASHLLGENHPMNVYVDNPIMVTRGSAEYRRCTVTNAL